MNASLLQDFHQPVRSVRGKSPPKLIDEYADEP